MYMFVHEHVHKYILTVLPLAIETINGEVFHTSMFYIVVMVCNIVYVSTCAQIHIDSVSPYYKNH